MSSDADDMLDETVPDEVDEPPIETMESPRDASAADAPPAGGTLMGAEARRRMLQRRVANPDDPVVRRPRYGKYGPLPGPDARGSLGRVAIVQGQIFIVGAIVIIQLFLITTALYELLSGRSNLLWWICAASLVAFVIALVVALWPRSRVRGF